MTKADACLPGSNSGGSKSRMTELPSVADDEATPADSLIWVWENACVEPVVHKNAAAMRSASNKGGAYDGRLAAPVGCECRVREGRHGVPRSKSTGVGGNPPRPAFVTEICSLLKGMIPCKAESSFWMLLVIRRGGAGTRLSHRGVRGVFCGECDNRSSIQRAFATPIRYQSSQAETGKEFRFG